MKPLFTLFTALIITTTLGLSSLKIQAEQIQKNNSTSNQVSAESQSHINTLLQAVKDNDYEKFMSVCDDTMKSSISAAQLEVVHEQLAESFKGGHEASYLGALQRGEYLTEIWKLSFDEQSNDTLVELSHKDGKVSGFILR